MSVVRRVLAAGQDVDYVPCLGGVKSNMGMTMLHWAVWFNARDSVEALVRAGANVDARDALGKTPMDLAVERKLGPEVTALLAKQRRPVGADTDIPG